MEKAWSENQENVEWLLLPRVISSEFFVLIVSSQQTGPTPVEDAGLTCHL